jgi:hypothetical protein
MIDIWGEILANCYFIRRGFGIGWISDMGFLF